MVIVVFSKTINRINAYKTMKVAENCLRKIWLDIIFNNFYFISIDELFERNNVCRINFRQNK